jgi:putative PEP-CTERM system histidine kinase
MTELFIAEAASVFLLALSVYIISKDRAMPSVLLSCSFVLLALMEILDQCSIHFAPHAVSFKKATIALESLLPLCFLFLSMTYARQRSTFSLSSIWWLLLGIALLFPGSILLFQAEDFFFSPDLSTERVLFLGTVGYIFYIAVMLYFAISLVNLEATFLATSGVGRWKMKFEFIGVMSIMAVLIFYYSQGLLYRTINMNLIPVRSGVLVISSFLIAYSRIIRGNGVRVVVSRHIFYRSVSLLIIGAYLLMLGLVGEGMKYFGISVSTHLGIFLAFVCGMAVFLLLFSEQLRRKAKVYINKHFYARKYDYREEWMKFTGRLALCETSADVRDAILSTYKEAFGLKGVSLYLPDRTRKVYSPAAIQELAAGPDIPSSFSLIQYFRERGRIFDPESKEFTLSAEEARIIDNLRTRLIVPLIGTKDVEGFVVLGKQLVPEELIYEDYDFMRTLAEQATLSLVNFRLSEELAENRELAAVANVASFVVHDLKNQTSTLSMLMKNAEEYIADAAFQQDMLNAIRNTVNQMKNLMEKLNSEPKRQELDIRPVEALDLVRRIVDDFLIMRPNVQAIVEGSAVTVLADSEEISKVILNFLLNSSDALNGEGMIRVETSRSNGWGFIVLRDNGHGMTEEYLRNHLFKPFRTTKKKGLGIGLYHCKQIIERHGGDIQVLSEEGKGSAFTLRLMLSNEGNA